MTISDLPPSPLGNNGVVPGQPPADKIKYCSKTDRVPRRSVRFGFKGCFPGMGSVRDVCAAVKTASNLPEELVNGELL